MSEPVPRSSRARLVAVLAAAGVLGGAGALFALSPWGARLTEALEATPAGHALVAPVRIATLEPGFRLHVDREGRFSVPVPETFRYDVESDGAWRLAGPRHGDLDTYLLIATRPMATGDTLASLDRRRDQELEERSDLRFVKLSSIDGTLDGLPALNRSFQLGKYQVWEVLIASPSSTPPYSLTLTFMCHEEAFPAEEPTFRRMLAGFRNMTGPGAAPSSN